MTTETDNPIAAILERSSDRWITRARAIIERMQSEGCLTRYSLGDNLVPQFPWLWESERQHAELLLSVEMRNFFRLALPDDIADMLIDSFDFDYICRKIIAAEL